MVFVKDPVSLRFLRFNKAGEDILGYDRNDLLGKSDLDLFPADQAGFFIKRDKDVLESGLPAELEEEPIQTRNGLRWLHTRKIPVIENGKPVYLLGISDDITERKKNLDAIKELNVELESFSYSVSHDLRAPLRAISGYASLLESNYVDSLDEEGRRLLGRIVHNAERMGALIDDLLSFARLGRKEVQKRKVDMNELVSYAIAEISRSLEHNTTFSIHRLHSINADRVLMTQVVINLIGNAIKYSSKIENPKVEVSSFTNENDIIFCVKDNGAGFDMLYVDKLFGVFQRLHRADEFEGTGVGLAIVQRIVRKHGGKVWAEGKVKGGAAFYFSLPSYS